MNRFRILFSLSLVLFISLLKKGDCAQWRHFGEWNFLFPDHFLFPFQGPIDCCYSRSRWEIEIGWNRIKTVLLTYRSLEDSEEQRFHRYQHVPILVHAIVYSSLLIIRPFTVLIQLSDCRTLEIPSTRTIHPASIPTILLFRLLTGSASIQVRDSLYRR